VQVAFKKAKFATVFLFMGSRVETGRFEAVVQLD
jgi:hypothetical protein